MPHFVDVVRLARARFLDKSKEIRKQVNDWWNTPLINDKSLFVFDVEHPIRKLALWWLDSSIFAQAVRVISVLFLLTIAFQSETDRPSVYVPIISLFLVAFWSEILIKCIAHGAVMNGPESHFRSYISVLDLFVTLCTSITVGSDIGYLRLWRPLRAISTFKGSFVLVQSVGSALMAVTDVFLIVIGVLYFLGLVALQLYAGSLRQQCVDSNTGLVPAALQGQLCSLQGRGVGGVYGFQCSSVPYVPPNSSFTTGHYDCLPVAENPASGLYSFDNIASAFLTNIIAISAEGWTDIMYYTSDANTPWSQLYFLFIMLLIPTILLEVRVPLPLHFFPLSVFFKCWGARLSSHSPSTAGWCCHDRSLQLCQRGGITEVRIGSCRALAASSRASRWRGSTRQDL